MKLNSPPEVNDFLTRQARDWHGDAKMPSRVTEAVRTTVFPAKKSGWLPRLSLRQTVAVCVFVVPVSFVATRFIATWLMPNPTLAAIAKAMSEVRTAQWHTEAIHTDPETGALVKTIRGHYRVDLKRNAARVESEPNYVYIYSTEGQFSLQGKRFVPVGTTGSTVNLRESLRRMVFNGQEVFKNKEEWEIGEIVVNGQRLLDLRRTVTQTVPTMANFSHEATVPPGTIGGWRQEIWADPKTLRILQNRIWAKYSDTNPPDGILNITRTTHRYEYDKPIPESVFQVVAPER